MTSLPLQQTRPTLRWSVVGIVLLAVLAASLLVGDLMLSPQEVWAALTGSTNEFTTTVVLSWRLPRAVAAMAFGAALGAAGMALQSLTRNPLGSPDVIGFNTGAHTGVLLLMLLTPTASFLSTAGAALAGGLLTALTVVVLAARSGLSGRSFILIGVGVSALLMAVNTWLLYRTDTATATAGSIWAAGSLDGVRWENLVPALIILLCAGVILGASDRRLRVLALGDDLATTLGLGVRSSRALIIAAAVVLTAITTAAAGPIMFVGLAAPHLARAVLPRSRPLAAAAAMGAVLLGGADWLAAHAFAPVRVPVGAATVCLGGAYLTVMLLRRVR